jgi:sugar-specific transcriptional regulator TrmB
MTVDSDSEARAEAVAQLTELGLGLYAARTFVALTTLSGGTAVEVGRAADVPRTRVYDAVDELSEAGLVDIDDTTPKRFTPVGVAEAADLLLGESETRAETLQDALTTLEAERDRS